jgi:DNA mismatch endonuclease, patch repair protein
MRGNRAKDTKPEVALRAELHRRGLRFRKHLAVIPGLRYAPDVVFPRSRVVVECRGCFWHLCRDHAVLPKSNLDYWLPKLERNAQRDARNEAALNDTGWSLIVIWEHDDLMEAADSVEAAVRAGR